MALLLRTEAEINKIMAHHSPVLIIQRHIRGVLTRKRYEKIINEDFYLTT